MYKVDFKDTFAKKTMRQGLAQKYTACAPTEK